MTRLNRFIAFWGILGAFLVILAGCGNNPVRPKPQPPDPVECPEEEPDDDEDEDDD